jgi:arylformamidase
MNLLGINLKSNNFIKLSYDLSPESPYPPAIPKLKTDRLMSIENGDGANVFNLHLTTHSGTHLDAPFHVNKTGIKVTDFRIDEFIFTKPLCINIAMNDKELFSSRHFEKYKDLIFDCDLLLIKTGYYKYRITDPERYIYRNPGFSLESAHYLRNSFPDLRGLGFDTPSLAAIDPALLDEGMEAHRILLDGENRHFVIFEDMNLGYDLKNLEAVIAMPLFIKGVDSSPCTILAIINN